VISVSATLKHYSSRLKMHRFKQSKKVSLDFWTRRNNCFALLYAVDTCVCVWLIVYAWYYIIRESYISRQKRIRWSDSERWQATRETEDTNIESETSGRAITKSVIGSDSYSTSEKEEKKRGSLPKKKVT